MPLTTKAATQTRPTIRAELGKEVVVTGLNEAGVMSDVSKAIAEKGISILAVSSAVDGVNRVIRLVTDDNLRARDALAKRGFDVREDRVILVEVPHKPGLLKHVSELLNGVQADIHHMYGSAALSAKTCVLVIASADNDAALIALSK